MDIKPKTKEKSAETDYQQVDINSLSQNLEKLAVSGCANKPFR